MAKKVSTKLDEVDWAGISEKIRGVYEEALMDDSLLKSPIPKDFEMLILSRLLSDELTQIKRKANRMQEDLDRTDREEVENLLDPRREESSGFKKKWYRLQYLLRQFDRINIAECLISDWDHKTAEWFSIITNTEVRSTAELYDQILEKERKQFGNMRESEKIFGEVLRENGEGSDFDQGIDLISDRIENVVRNYYELYPPLVKAGVKISKKLKEIYAESRWCYVLQSYRASVTLCRAIIELTIKNKLKQDPNSSIGPLDKRLELAYESGIISTDARRIGHDIRKLANKVLHAGKKVQKECAYKAVEKTKDFLEEVCN